MSSDSPIQVITTTETAEEAERIAQDLLEKRLAACIQIVGPITSRYWWKGKQETAQEWQCIAKTTAEHYREVEETIRTLHSYDVPEIIALPILKALPAYLDWLRDCLKARA